VPVGCDPLAAQLWAAGGLERKEMNDPIYPYSNTDIQLIRWQERFWTLVICLIVLVPLTAAGTFILTDEKFMNKPIVEHVREVTVWEVQDIYEATILEEGKWDFIPKDTPIKKEK
jgi:hypothetical protein